MKLDIFLVIGLMVNVFMAVLYPTQIFGDDPLGLSGIQQGKLEDYYTVNGTGIINSYDNNSGTLAYNSDIFDSMEAGVGSADGNEGVFTSDVFGFVDWVTIGWNLLKSMLMFVIGFIFMLWNLAYPLNFLVGVPFSLLYIFSMASFIIGRS